MSVRPNPQERNHAEPIPALRHSGAGNRGGDAVAMLTIYLVLLLGVPSGITIVGLGSLGRPSLLWGLVLFGWWLVSRLQVRHVDVTPIRQPVRIAYLALLVVAFVSFAAAMLRGQPSDQVSPAIIAIVRLLSWGGVLLVVVDGVRSMNDLARLTRCVLVGVGLLAALGIVQFATGSPIVDFFASIPGLSGAEGTIGARGGVVRASGTAIHALEYGTALNATLPLAIAAAVTHGFRFRQSRAGWLWWVPVGLISTSALIAVSRSAIIGFGIAVVLMLPALPRRFRGWAVAAALVLGAAVVIAVPGLFGTTASLFLDAADDPSTASRVSGLDRAPEFVANSPLYGAGFGTFLPRYYIFDNQWVYTAVELGILGVLALAGILLAAVWSALRGRRMSTQPDTRILGYALAVSMAVTAVLFAFFDGLAFPISGGLFFLFAGMCTSVATIGATDRAMMKARPRHVEED
jgi:polysaccharide biosynthesis protein PslJ